MIKYVVNTNQISSGWKFTSVCIWCKQVDKLQEYSSFVILGHSVRLLGKKKKSGKKTGGAALNLPKVRKNPLIEIIAINTG